MKKTLLFFCSILILGLTACTKTEYLPTEVINGNRTIYVTIQPSSWTYEPSRGWWWATADIDEIDDLIMDPGTIVADISFDDGETYESLSTTVQQRGYSFIYSRGQFSIYYQSTAADEDIERPENAALVKLVLIDSEFVD